MQDRSTAYLRKACVHNQVKKAPEKFVPHEDGKQQVAENKGTSVLSWILPNIQCSEKQPNTID